MRHINSENCRRHLLHSSARVHWFLCIISFLYHDRARSNGWTELYSRHHDNTKCFPDVSSLFSYLTASCNSSGLIQFIFLMQLWKGITKKRRKRFSVMRIARKCFLCRLKYCVSEREREARRKLINFSSAVATEEKKKKIPLLVERKWKSGRAKVTFFIIETKKNFLSFIWVFHIASEIAADGLFSSFVVALFNHKYCF